MDPIFNSGPGAIGRTRPLAILPDGRVLIGDYLTTYNGTACAGLARVMPNGTLDPSFAPGSGPNRGPVTAVLPLSNGQLLVSGWFTSFSGVSRNYIIRLNADGSVDPSFDALLEVPAGDAFINFMIAQLDGGVLIAGVFRLPGETASRAVARLHPDGTVDASFDCLVTGYGVRAMALQPDGRILISGSVYSPEDPSRSGLIRLRRDGSLDVTFHPDLGNSYVTPSAIAVEPDGKIMLGANQQTRRLLPDGTRDPEWIGSSTTAYASPYGLAVQPDGKILIAGSIGSTGVARLNRDGTLDSSFNVGTGTSLAQSLLLEPSGAVLIGGQFSSFNGVARAGLVRLFGGEPAMPGAGVVGFVHSDQFAAERSGFARIPVVRTGGNTGAVTVAYAITPDSAGTDDFTAASGTVTFADGETTKWIEVPILDDQLTESDETFTLALSNPTGGTTLGLTRSTVTIEDDDDRGKLEWRFDSFTVDEEEANVTLTASRAGGTTGTVSVDFSTASGTATAGSDFAATSGTLTFADGENWKTVTIPLHEDTIKEGRESFTVTLSNPVGGAVLSSRCVATITLVDDDNPGSIDRSFDAGLVFDGYSGSVGALAEQVDGKVLVGGSFESFGGVTRRSLVRLNPDGTVDPTFDAHLPDGAHISDIVIQSDGRILVLGYSLVSGKNTSIARLTPDGALDPTFNYGSGGGCEHAAIQLDGRILVSGYFLGIGGGPERRLIRLQADGSEDPAFVASSVGTVRALAVQSDGRILVACLSTPGLLRLHPGGERDTEFVLDPSVSTSSTVNCVALQPDGKILAAGIIGFPAQYISRAIVRFNPDGSLDPSFGPVSYSSPDSYPQTSSMVPQGDGRIVLNGIIGNARFARLNSDGSVDSSFETGGIYRTSPALMLHDGALLTVTASPMRVTKLIGGTLDSTAPVALNFTWGDTQISEAAGQVGVWVSRTGGNLGTCSVDYETSNGTAVADHDYTESVGTLTFGPDEVAKRVLIPIFDTAAIDGSRTFQLTLRNPSGATLANPAVANITVIDDERPGRLAFGASSFVVREGGEISVAVQRTLGTQGQVSASIVAFGGTADSATDYLVSATSVSFAPGETQKIFTIQAKLDGAVEGDETFTIQLTQPTGGVSLAPSPSPAVRIYDVDDPGSYDPSLVLDSTRIYASVSLPGGGVILGGAFTAQGLATSVVHLGPDGIADTNFPQVSVPGSIYAIARQSEGDLVVVGSFAAVNGSPRKNIARLLPDGTLDPAFASGSTIDGSISDVGVQSDDKLIIAGTFTTVNGIARKGLARLNSDGTLDTTFRAAVEAPAGRVLITPDDKIVYAPNSSDIIRLNPDGTRDVSFTASLSRTWATPIIRDMALDRDGRLIVTGYFDRVNSLTRYNLARLLPDGRVDPVFDAALPAESSAADRLLLQADGRILWGGYPQHSPRTPVVRLLENGSLDPTFSLVPNSINTAGHFTALVVLPQRGLLVSGSFTEIDGVTKSDVALLRLGWMPGSFRIAQAPAVNVREGDAVTVQVERIGGSDGPATVSYETLAGTAAAGTDFVPVGGTLTFEHGQTSASFTVTTVDNDAYERDEQFSVNLTAVEGAYLSTTANAVAVKIEDNDPPQVGQIQFVDSAIAVNEADGVVVIPVERVSGSDETSSVDFVVNAGSAAFGNDYMVANGTVALGPGETSGTIRIPLVNDWIRESLETFVVQLSGPLAGPRSLTTVTIEDTDFQRLETFRGTYSGVIVPFAVREGPYLLRLSVTGGRLVTGYFDTGGHRYVFRTRLDSSGFASISLRSRGRDPMVLKLQLDILGDAERITGTLEVDAQVFPITADRLRQYTATQPAAAAGRYNIALLDLAAVSAGGDGYAHVVVSPSGAVRCVGSCGDGTPWNWAGALSRDGHAGIFVPLYRRNGLLQGELVFTQSGDLDCAGYANWSRGALSDPGSLSFDVPLIIDGSEYRPLPGQPALGFSTGTAFLTNDSLPEFAQEFTLSSQNRFTISDPNPQKFSLILDARTGLISGTFRDPNGTSSRASKLRGVVLPDSQRAVGYFIGPAASGKVELLAN